MRATLKWPNDVLVNDGKIAGILVESADDALILGIGVDVLQAPGDVSYKVSTIVGCGGLATVDGARDRLLAALGNWLAMLAAGRVRADPCRLAGTRASGGEHAERARGRALRCRHIRRHR